MNKWVFASILPYVNKDVELLGEYENSKKKIKCRCKKCCECFEAFPNDLLQGKLHSRKALSRCKWSYQNADKVGSKKYLLLVDKLSRFYKAYSQKYDFLTPYVSDDIEIQLRNKSSGEIVSLFIGEITSKTKKGKRHTVAKEKKKNKEYLFYDSLNEITILCTVHELCKYAGRGLSYYYLWDISNLKWFKHRFRIINKYVSQTYCSKESDYTNIHKRCEKYVQCARHGFECDFCWYKNKPFYSKKEYHDLSVAKNPGIELSEFSDRRVPIVCKCKTCGFVFEKLPREVLNGVSCSNCNASSGEQIVSAYLDSLGIKYEKEKTFDDLSDIRKLRFDFYLPNENAVIEFDGLQHSRPVMFYAKTVVEAISSFEKLRHRDELKNDYCRKNKIQLLRIPYYEKDVYGKIDRFLSVISKK